MRKSLLLLLAYILPFVGYATTSEPPVITLDPVASSICGGGSISFTTASNDPAATYSWEYYDGSIWQFANNPALFSGIGTATLTVTNVIGKDGWFFRTQAINGGGESPLTPYVRLTVDVVAPVASLTGANWVAPGNTVNLNGTGSGRNPVWVSSNPGSAAVNGSGVVTGITVGSTIISYTISNACGTSTDTQMMTITPVFPSCEEWTSVTSGLNIRGNSARKVAIASDTTGKLYVSYADSATGLLYAKKFNGSTWESVGTGAISDYSFLAQSIAVDLNGVPYVAYKENGNAPVQKVIVKKFDGTNWVSVASPVVSSTSTTEIDKIQINAGPDGSLWLSFNNDNDNNYPYIFSYDGTSWIPRVNTNISGVYFPITVDSAGVLYTVWNNNVYRYDGGVSLLGGGSYAATGANPTGIYTDKAGHAAVLYEDPAAVGQASVKRYNGSTWESLGSPGVGTLHGSSILVDNTGSVLVGIIDQSSTNIAHIYKYEGSSWVSAWDAELPGGVIDTTFILMGANNKPVLAALSGGSFYVNKTIAIKPTVVAGNIPGVPQGNTTATLPYSDAKYSPVTYSIKWSAAATTAGFANVTDASLPASAITLSVPATAAIDSYFAKIVFKNVEGCIGDSQIIKVNVIAPNIAPSFTLSSPQSISLCQNAVAMDVKSLLHVADADEEQTLTWTVSNAAAHGTVTVTGATASTGTADIAPGGTISYQPTTGYSGADSFTIQVSDGIATATQKIRVTVKGGPAVTTQPVSDTVCGGGTGVFTVAAGDPVLSYQWQVGGDGVNFTDISFATNSTFTVPPPVGSTISGAFVRCVLTGTCGAGNSDVVRFIMSSPNATITTVPVSCNGGSNGRATATVGGGLPPYTYSWSPAGGSLASATGLTARAYTVTVQDAFGCQTQKTATVTQPAAITASVSDQTNVVCYGAATGSIAVAATGGSGALSYSWAPSGGTAATATGLAAGTYTCTITDTNSCSRTQTATITQPGVYSVAVTAQHNVSCAGGNTGDAAISVTGGQAPFSYSWVPSVSSTTSAAGLTAGIYTATVTDDNGCEASKVITITEPAALNVSITSQTNVTCNGGNNGQLQAAATGGVPTYVYSWSPAGTTGTVATSLTAGSQTVTVTDGNGCTDTANTLVTEPAPMTAAISAASAVCFGSITTVTITGTPYAGINYLIYGGLPQAGGFDSAGVFIVNSVAIYGPTLYSLSTVNYGECSTNVSGSVTINALDIPVVNDVTSQAICNNSNTDAIAFTGTGTEYTWSNSNAGIGLAASGSGDIAAFTAVNATNSIKTGTVTVTPKSGECVGTPVNFTIAVKPTPTVNSYPDLVGCNGGAFDGTVFTGNMTGTAYNWTNSDPSIGVAASGVGDIAEFDGVNSSNITHIASVVVTPTNNGCTGATDTMTITVYPTPTVDATADLAVCNNLPAPAIHFAGSVSGTVFNWNNNNASIGLGATNTTDIASFTAINAGTEPVMAMVTVLPTANGCAGARDTFTITVNPTPVADPMSGQAHCDGAATLPVVFNSATTGTTYTWSNNNSSIGLASTGAGNIASFAAVNAGTTTTIATVTVTPEANSCAGADVTMVYTVYPTPHMTPIADQSLCNGFNTTAVTFGSSVAGSAYSWTNTNSLIGLALYGSTFGIPSFPANNSGTATLVSTVVVTPTANGCVGTTDTFSYTVTPTPTVNAIGGQVLCNTDTTTAISFSGAVAGSVYSWTNTNAAVGLANSGTGDIASFAVVNTGNVFDTATVVVTPSIGACLGATQTFDIVVKPTPTVDVVSSQALCNNTATADVTFTGAVAGTVNNWVNTNTAIGLATSGAGNILSFTATNTTVAPISGTVTVTPSANGCTGASRNFTYTVNPTPKLTTAQTGTVCSGTPYTYAPGSATTGVSYAWTRAVAAGISNAAGSGSGSVGETLYNTTLATKTTTYRYTLTANGCSNLQNVVVTVNPTPQAPVIAVTAPANVCSQTMNMNFGAATAQPDTVQYTWTAIGATVLAKGTGHQNAIVSFPEAGNATVVLTANAAGFSCSARDTFAVTVSNSVANNALVYYIHDHFIYTDNTVSTYQWGYDDATTLDSVMLTGQVDQNYFDGAPDFTNKKYWVMTTKDGCLSKSYYNAPTGVVNVNSTVTVNLTVVPNPASNYVTVAVDGLTGGNDKVELTDLTGKTVMTEAVASNKAQLSVSNLASGIYIVTYYHNGIKAGAAKLVKE